MFAVTPADNLLWLNRSCSLAHELSLMGWVEAKKMVVIVFLPLSPYHKENKLSNNATPILYNILMSCPILIYCCVLLSDWCICWHYKGKTEASKIWNVIMASINHVLFLCVAMSIQRKSRKKSGLRNNSIGWRKEDFLLIDQTISQEHCIAAKYF